VLNSSSKEFRAYYSLPKLSILAVCVWFFALAPVWPGMEERAGASAMFFREPFSLIRYACSLVGILIGGALSLLILHAVAGVPALVIRVDTVQACGVVCRTVLLADIECVVASYMGNLLIKRRGGKSAIGIPLNLLAKPDAVLDEFRSRALFASE
jgi:hypothetical protein